MVRSLLIIKHAQRVLVAQIIVTMVKDVQIMVQMHRQNHKHVGALRVNKVKEDRNVIITMLVQDHV